MKSKAELIELIKKYKNLYYNYPIDKTDTVMKTTYYFMLCDYERELEELKNKNDKDTN